MLGSCFARRLGNQIALSPAERAALEQLEERERPVRRGMALVRERDPLGEIFILRRGMMISYLLLDDGNRQILRFLFPGDVLAASLIYAHSPEAVTALTDCVVAAFDRSVMARLLVEQPRLYALITATIEMDRVALTDRLAGLGRTSAKSRVAALLLDIRNRMREFDDRVGASFVLGLTQEEIGDATGLTAVHVNRMLRELADERVILREGSRVTVGNEEVLARIAQYVDRRAGLDFSWLPPAR